MKQNNGKVKKKFVRFVISGNMKIDVNFKLKN